MKITTLLAFAALAAGGNVPQIEWDPATVKDCVGWYDNGGTETCEYVRHLFGISPELFTKWNPSVGLDCKPWRFQSYCIITQERVDEWNRLHPSSTTKTASTTTAGTTAVSTKVTAEVSPTGSLEVSPGVTPGVTSGATTEVTAAPQTTKSTSGARRNVPLLLALF